MSKNISTSFRGIIIISKLFNRLNRNTASRVISLFEMPIEKIINFARLFYSTIVLRKSKLLANGVNCIKPEERINLYIKGKRVKKKEIKIY